MSFEQTQNYQAYVRYRELKQQWRLIYKGVNLVEACALDLTDALVVQRKADFYHVVCAMLQRIRVKPLFRAFFTHKNVFTFAAHKPKDHRELSQAIFESVDDAAWVSIEYYYSPYKAITRWVYFLFKVRSLRTPFVNRAFIAARMAGYSCVLDDLEKRSASCPLNGKQYIPFCAPAHHEALLTLFFKNKGVKTYNTVHGIFGRYLHTIANDVVNGENIISDYVLTFGESQRMDLIRDFNIAPERVKVAGNPKYPSHTAKIRTTFHSCLILGGIGLYDNELRLLLQVVEQVAQQTDITFTLKPHPLSAIHNDPIWASLKHIRLLGQEHTIKELFLSGNYDFAITHNTFSYYESMLFGLKPFRWALNENLDFEGLNDRFSTAQELSQLIKDAKGSTSEMLTDEIRQILHDVLGMGINNYNQIING